MSKVIIPVKRAVLNPVCAYIIADISIMMKIIINKIPVCIRVVFNKTFAEMIDINAEIHL